MQNAPDLALLAARFRNLKFKKHHKTHGPFELERNREWAARTAHEKAEQDRRQFEETAQAAALRAMRTISSAPQLAGLSLEDRRTLAEDVGAYVLTAVAQFLLEKELSE